MTSSKNSNARIEQRLHVNAWKISTLVAPPVTQDIQWRNTTEENHFKQKNIRGEVRYMTINPSSWHHKSREWVRCGRNLESVPCALTELSITSYKPILNRCNVNTLYKRAAVRKSKTVFLRFLQINCWKRCPDFKWQPRWRWWRTETTIRSTSSPFRHEKKRNAMNCVDWVLLTRDLLQLIKVSVASKNLGAVCRLPLSKL